MKTLLTKKTIATITKHIAHGATQHFAAAVGISRRTLFNWGQQGKRAKSGIYRVLFVQLQRAEAQFVSDTLAVIAKAGRVSWQASAWLLERRYPDQFGRTDRYQAHLLKELQAKLASIRAELAKQSHPR